MARGRALGASVVNGHEFPPRRYAFFLRQSKAHALFASLDMAPYAPPSNQNNGTRISVVIGRSPRFSMSQLPELRARRDKLTPVTF